MNDHYSCGCPSTTSGTAHLPTCPFAVGRITFGPPGPAAEGKPTRLFICSNCKTLRAEVERLKERTVDLEADLETTKHLAKEFAEKNASLRDENLRRHSRIAALEEALRPFAQIKSDGFGKSDFAARITQFDGKGINIFWYQLREAARVMEGKT